MDESINKNVDQQTKKDKGLKIIQSYVQNYNLVSKKEERKEKRQAAKNLVETSAPKSMDEKKPSDIQDDKSTNPKFCLKKLPTNSPDFVHANIQPTAPAFPIHDYGAKAIREQYLGREMCLTIRGKDKFWFQIFDDIGKKREMQFADNTEGEYSIPKHHLKIKTVYNDESGLNLFSSQNI